MTHELITDKEKIKKILQDTWESDLDFFDKLSVFETPELSIKDTTDKICSFVDSDYDGRFYVLMNGCYEIGYIVTSTKINLLFSFGIKKEFRNDNNKKYFFKVIDTIFPKGQVAVSVFKKNLRAVNFFKKYGYEEIKEETTTLVKNK